MYVCWERYATDVSAKHKLNNDHRVSAALAGHIRAGERLRNNVNQSARCVIHAHILAQRRQYILIMACLDHTALAILAANMPFDLRWTNLIHIH